MRGTGMRVGVVVAVVSLMAWACVAQEVFAQGRGSCQGGMQGRTGMMGQGPSGMGQGAMGGMGQGAMGQGAMRQGGMGGGQGMGQGMNGGQGRMDRQQLLANMQVNPCDPAAALAVKDKINLTPMQVKNLQKALARIRRQTEQILTADQRQQLETLIGPADAPPAKQLPPMRKGPPDKTPRMHSKAPADQPTTPPAE